MIKKQISVKPLGDFGPVNTAKICVLKWILEASLKLDEKAIIAQTKPGYIQQWTQQLEHLSSTPTLFIMAPSGDENILATQPNNTFSGYF